jgi:hypothetical protein
MANTASPTRKDLDTLAGEWQVELSFPANPPRTVLGHVSFEWLEDGAFLVMRSGNKSSGPPSLTRSHTVFVPSTATARKDRTAWIGDSK